MLSLLQLLLLISFCYDVVVVSKMLLCWELVSSVFCIIDIWTTWFSALSVCISLILFIFLISPICWAWSLITPSKISLVPITIVGLGPNICNPLVIVGSRYVPIIVHIRITTILCLSTSSISCVLIIRLSCSSKFRSLWVDSSSCPPVDMLSLHLCA